MLHKIASVLGFVFLISCGTQTNSFSTAKAAGTSDMSGTFKMYGEPHAQVNPNCDLYTEMKIVKVANSYEVTLKNKISATSTCEIAVIDNTRKFTVYTGPKTDSCGSVNMTIGDFDNDTHTLTLGEITDNRGRLCENVVPALLVLNLFKDQERTPYQTLYSNP